MEGTVKAPVYVDLGHGVDTVYIARPCLLSVVLPCHVLSIF